MMRFSKWLLGLGFGLMMITIQPAFAGTIGVTTTTDGIGIAGCILREAVEYADGGAAEGCTGATNPGADIITLPTGTYTLTTNAEITVDTAITIEPDGASVVTIEADALENNSSHRVFLVTTTGALTLNALTVQHGGGNTFAGQGGCIRIDGVGALTLATATLQKCRAINSAAVYGAGMGHSITITDSIIQDNRSSDDGSGVESWQGTISVSGSGTTFAGNQAQGASAQEGAGTFNAYDTASSTVTLTDVTFDGNSAIADVTRAESGAFLVFSYNATITDVTISNNSVQAVTLGYSGGGAIATAAMTATRLTVTGNTLTTGMLAQGGGLLIQCNAAPTCLLDDSVIEDNSATATGAPAAGAGGGLLLSGFNVEITDSRIQRNTARGDGDGLYNDDTGAVSSISNSCIVGNGDVAVANSARALVLTAGSNWWGSAWGPQIPALTGSLSALSTGDSISGDGSAPIDVGLTNAGTYTGPGVFSPATGPTGNWLMSAPEIPPGSGVTCLVCGPVSALGRARTCT